MSRLLVKTMQPFNPYDIEVTAEEIRNFLRYEFPLVPEAPPRTSKAGLQQLAQKWINFHTQAEAAKRSQRTDRNDTDIKPVINHDFPEGSKHTAKRSQRAGRNDTDIKPVINHNFPEGGKYTDKPKKTNSTRVTQNPRASESSSTVNDSNPPALSPSDLDSEILLLADTGDRKSLKSSARSVSSKNQKGGALPEKHGSLAAPTPKAKPAPIPRKKAAAIPKNKPATKNSIAQKPNQLVAVKQPLSPSPTNSTFPGSSVQMKLGSRSSQTSSRHKRDSDEAFSDTEQESAEKENIRLSPKRSKKEPTQPPKKSSASAPKRDSITRNPKPSKPYLPAHVSTLGPSRPRQHVRFSRPGSSPGSDTSSLTPLGSSDSSSDVECDDRSVSKGKDSLVASDSKRLVTAAEDTVVNKGPKGESSSSKQKAYIAPDSTDPLPESTELYKCDCRKEIFDLKSRVQFLEQYML
ncbi:uncharacterized protein MELLADRAFT_65125 [Melampsora larici-populina 98AG31]|uniref:Uncharacterized protein n=1 Tax=Melampsora larici-populina (strain 98AG31 / pathotype 3-4-7) TaxID=747676 RepID=F4RU29_MELLP|nr:uncharacterized protein MELLADRAFT_65125 [Melampsora larici-populina 98AG31]EGG04153.1 hypothetical protein MELLADRAFT_65125 [Melampsora larici-populina 98AG31]